MVSLESVDAKKEKARFLGPFAYLAEWTSAPAGLPAQRRQRKVGSSLSADGRISVATGKSRPRLCKNSLEIPASEVRRWRHCRFSRKLAEMENRKSPLRL